MLDTRAVHCVRVLQVFGLQAGVAALEPTIGILPLQPLLQPLSAVYYFKRLLLANYWSVVLFMTLPSV